MDTSIQRALNDKVYDRRKAGALELEKLIREAVAADNWDKIAKVVDQLCHDYAYSIHQPYARNGGLIGLAAASIALGPDVARYLDQIVPPVLACFGDQDARVRYYACESMYNIAKTSKGEILPYFNEVFDALSKLAADSEMSVKNGSDLLDRLLKDIVSESATSYVSLINPNKNSATKENGPAEADDSVNLSPAFSLARFVPLLKERIFVINPFTRMFLVSWITLMDSIPDLELVSYLPSFLGGLFRFLSDQHQDVVTATQHVLERFLEEIKHVAKVKREIADSRKSGHGDDDASSMDAAKSEPSLSGVQDDKYNVEGDELAIVDTENDQSSMKSGGGSDSDAESQTDAAQDNWIPGQDVQIDHPKILEILVTYLHESPEEHIQLTALRWIDSFFEICPEDILIFAPRLLNQVLPALSSSVGQVRQAGVRVNSSLMEYVLSLPDDDPEADTETATTQVPTEAFTSIKEANDTEARGSVAKTQNSGGQRTPSVVASPSRPSTPAPAAYTSAACCQKPSLDYEASVSSLTLQFLNEHEATRVAALSWLIMLQRKAPRKVLAAHDGTFPALLKTLSDPSDTVVTRDLQLLSQIAKKSDDSFFTSFMVNLLQLFSTDRRLLETRGNVIIRQLCLNLSPERIYRTMADCLEKDEDIEFNTIMVQNLNNNLLTAPELAELRRKLRYWESRESQTLFVTLFRAWCHNSVATISLCLLAQAYEQAYNILQTFADIEMSVNMLIQIDKLVQLLESPVFTYLRLQLLEPATAPYLYKTLYGILMLLPQSAAFAALKNRLNSISAIGYLHMPQPMSAAARTGAGQGASTGPGFERANRLKSKDEGTGVTVKWNELLEKFKSVQEKRRGARQRSAPLAVWDDEANKDPSSSSKRLGPAAESAGRKAVANSGGFQRPPSSGDTLRPPLSAIATTASAGQSQQSEGSALGSSQQGKDSSHKSKFSASNFGRIATGVRNKTKK